MTKTTTSIAAALLLLVPAVASATGNSNSNGPSTTSATSTQNQAQTQTQTQGQGQGQYQQAHGGDASSLSNGTGIGVGVGGAGGGGGTGGNTGDYSTKNSAGPVVMYNQNPIPLPQAVTGDSVTVLSDVYQFGPFGWGTQVQRMTPLGANDWLTLAHRANWNDTTYEDQQRQFEASAVLCADEGGFGEKLAKQLGVGCK